MGVYSIYVKFYLHVHEQIAYGATYARYGMLCVLPCQNKKSQFLLKFKYVNIKNMYALMNLQNQLQLGKQNDFHLYTKMRTKRNGFKECTTQSVLDTTMNQKMTLFEMIILGLKLLTLWKISSKNMRNSFTHCFVATKS